MRTTAPFRFFVPGLLGLLVGMLFALALFMIPVSFSGETVWNRVGEVYNYLHYPASRLAAAWRAAGLPPRGQESTRVIPLCAIVAQWLLLGIFAGTIWLWLGRSREKSGP